MTIIAIIQLILFSISIYRKKDTKNSKFILIFLLLSFCLFLTGNFVILFKINRAILNIAHICNLIVFLSAPLLYIFISHKIDKRISLPRKYLLHFIPFIIIIGLMTFKIYYLDGKIFAYTKNGIVLISLLFLQNTIYFVAIYRKLLTNGINLLKINQDSSLGVRWLRKLFLMFSIIHVLQLFIFVFCGLFDVMLLCVGAVGISFVITFLLINNIILFGLSKPVVFDFNNKYQNNPINNKDEYINLLEKALHDEEVYCDPLISLEKLSKQLHIPKNYLSQIINDNYSLNFNELINKYRIRKVTEKLNNNKEDATIIDIAYEVGFNAKSTFNTAFKKFTKMTPTQYLSQAVGKN